MCRRDKEAEIKALTITVLSQQERLEKLEQKIFHWDSTTLSNTFAAPTGLIRTSQQISSNISPTSTSVTPNSGRRLRHTDQGMRERDGRVIPPAFDPSEKETVIPGARIPPESFQVPFQDNPASSPAPPIISAVNNSFSTSLDPRIRPARGEIDNTAFRPGKKIIPVSSTGEERLMLVGAEMYHGIIDRNLDVNVISLSLVEYLGKPMKPLEPGLEGMEFQFGLGRRGKCLGTVVMLWTKGRAVPSPTMSLDFFVCEDAPISLVRPVKIILGKPYLVG